MATTNSDPCGDSYDVVMSIDATGGEPLDLIERWLTQGRPELLGRGAFAGEAAPAALKVV